MAPRLRCDGGITGSLFVAEGFEMRFPQLHLCLCKRDGRFVFIARGKIMCFIFRFFKLAINKLLLINTNNLLLEYREDSNNISLHCYSFSFHIVI